MPPKTPKTPKPEETCSHGECLQLMEKMIENLSKLIKETYEKQMEVLQAEIFSLKKEVDIEKTRRKRLEEKTTGLQDDVKVLNASMNFTLNKLDDHEQEKRSCDIIIDNLDDITEVRDASQHVCQVVNSTLMGTIIEKSDIKNTKIIKNKFKMTIITTLSSEANKEPSSAKKCYSEPKTSTSKKISRRSDISSSKKLDRLRRKTTTNTRGQEMAISTSERSTTPTSFMCAAARIWTGLLTLTLSRPL